MIELKLHQLKNKEAKLAFDLAVSEIPSLEEELLDAISTNLDLRKAAKTAKKIGAECDKPELLAAVAVKFAVLFRQLMELEKNCDSLGLDSRKFFKAQSEALRLREKFESQLGALEDSAQNLGFDLKKTCGFLYQEKD